MAVFLVVMASGALLAGLISLVAGGMPRAMDARGVPAWLGTMRRQNRRDRPANRGEPVIGVTR